MIIRSSTPGPLCTLIVDVTENSCGFEHQVSRDLAAELSKRGIAITANSPALVSDEQGFYLAFKNAGVFSVLLLVGHGAKDLGGKDASHFGGPGAVKEWHSTIELTEGMQDKVVLLCVCDGYCQDAVDAFVTESSLCLSLIGSNAILTASEARNFFPNFLETLKPDSLQEIDPIALKRALEINNHYANGKMRLVSDGLPQ